MIGKITSWTKANILAIVNRTDNFEEDDCRDTIIINNGKLRYKYNNSIEEYDIASIDKDELNDTYIAMINSEGVVSSYLSVNSKEIDLFVTNKCNSNCIMCPLAESVRRKNNLSYLPWNLKFVELLPNDISYINITGGEPTLVENELIVLLKAVSRKFDSSCFQLLTNGRTFSNKKMLLDILQVLPRGTRIAIPLHSSDSKVHDMITQSDGSFAQTDMGIKNLLKYKQNVEVRIVLSKININTIYDTARYIVEEYKNVLSVNFVAMEIMGNAALNKRKLWIEFEDLFANIKGAVQLLVKNGIDVELYNFPLCYVDKGYWSIASRSISDYKIQYVDDCKLCRIKEICGGFFGSTRRVINPKVKPIV